MFCFVNIVDDSGGAKCPSDVEKSQLKFENAFHVLESAGNAVPICKLYS